MYKEWNTMKLRFVVMLILMSAAAVALVALKELTVSVLNSPQMQAYMKSMPGRFSQMVKEIASNFAYYSFTQWFGKNYQQLAALTAIIFSFSLFSKEFEKKTIYILVSRMTRWQVYFSKLLMGYLLLSVVVIAGGVVYAISAKVYNYNLPIGMTASWTVTTLFGSLLLYQIGTFTSLMFKDQIKPFLLDILIYVGLYVCGIFKPTEFLGLFSYMASADVLQGKGVNVLASFVVITISAMIFIGEYYHFRSMEL